MRPSATSIGCSQPPPSRLDTQMLTSPWPSRVPANQAATRPSAVSAMVEACAAGNGACSKMNSLNKLSVRVPASAILDKAGERRIHRPMIFSAALIASARSQSRVYRGSRRYHAISAHV